MRQATAELPQRLPRLPEDRELARHLRVSDAQLRMAQYAELAFEPTSLDAPRPGWLDAGGLVDHLGGDDPQLERAVDLAAVRAHFSELPAREQRLLRLRFCRNMSQREISHELAISQMHVSRLLRQAIGYLCARVPGPEVGAGARHPALPAVARPRAGT
jgi:RNA polymerase sigma-B factor